MDEEEGKNFKLSVACWRLTFEHSQEDLTVQILQNFLSDEHWQVENCLYLNVDLNRQNNLTKLDRQLNLIN